MVEERHGLLNRMAGTITQWWREASGGQKLTWVVLGLLGIAGCGLDTYNDWKALGSLGPRVEAVEDSLGTVAESVEANRASHVADSIRLDELVVRLEAVEQLDTLVAEVRGLRQEVGDQGAMQRRIYCLVRADAGLESYENCIQ